MTEFVVPPPPTALPDHMASAAVNAQLDEARIAALVRRRRGLNSELAGIKGEIEMLDAQIKALVPVGWKQDIDGVTAAYRPPNRAFNPEIARMILPPEVIERCIPAPCADTKLLRAEVEKLGRIEECMVDGGGNPILSLA